MNIVELIDILYKTINSPGTKNSVHTVVFIFALVTGLMEFSKIDLSPWTWFLKKIGNIMTTDLTKRVKDIETRQQDMEKHQEDIEKLEEKREALYARRRILRANDDILNDKKHSKDFFDETLEDITLYEDYCELHKDPSDPWHFVNGKCTESIKNIRREYRDIEKTGGFKTVVDDKVKDKDNEKKDVH